MKHFCAGLNHILQICFVLGSVFDANQKGAIAEMFSTKNSIYLTPAWFNCQFLSKHFLMFCFLMNGNLLWHSWRSRTSWNYCIILYNSITFARLTNKETTRLKPIFTAQLIICCYSINVTKNKNIANTIIDKKNMLKRN